MSARIALAEAGAVIDLVEVDTHAGRMLETSDDYRAINPLGYVPALRLDDGTVLTENSAILQYIADHYPGGAIAPPPTDRVGRAKLRQWLSFIIAELHKSLMTPLLGANTPPEVKAWTVNKYAPRLAYLDDKLQGREFLLDRFSVADGYLATVLNWTQATPEIDLCASSQRESLSRAHAGEAERRRGFGDRASAVPCRNRAAQSGVSGRTKRPARPKNKGRPRGGPAKVGQIPQIRRLTARSGRPAPSGSRQSRGPRSRGATSPRWKARVCQRSLFQRSLRSCLLCHPCPCFRERRQPQSSRRCSPRSRQRLRRRYRM